jgi:hypothetical protein
MEALHTPCTATRSDRYAGACPRLVGRPWRGNSDDGFRVQAGEPGLSVDVIGYHFSALSKQSLT